MIVEKNGRFTCNICGYEWSAMLGDDPVSVLLLHDAEIPEKCQCEEKRDKKLLYWQGVSNERSK